MEANNESTPGATIPAVYRKIGFLEHIHDGFLNNPHCHRIRDFKRGEIINKQANTSDWIYIVIQGSVSVLKEIKPTTESVQRNPGIKNAALMIGQELVPFDKSPDKRSYNRQLTIYQNTYQVEKRLEQTLPGYLNFSDRLGSLPYDSIIQQHKQRVFKKAAAKSNSLPEIVINDVTPRDLSHAESRRLPPIKQNSKGFYLSVSRRRPYDNDVTESAGTTDKQYKQHGRKPRFKGSRQNWKQSRLRSYESTSTHHNGKDEKSNHPTYILLTVLEKGQYFGLDEILFQNQARCSLVSNGAVCGLISKRSFLQHAEEDTIHNLRMSENPHPSTPMLRNQLKKHVKWADYRARIYKRLVDSKERMNRLKAQFHSQCPGQYCFRTGPR